MSARPALLFHCQHSLGLGHLRRSLALCAALAERFRVVLLSGGPLPDGLPLPAGVEVVALPPLELAADRRLVSTDGHTVVRAQALRRARILATVAAVRPQVIVVELFPFGRRKFAAEIVPLLQAARGRALTVCSVRDILVGRGERQARHDDRAAALADRLLDLVLVHADPRFARLEESFRPATPLRTPVRHTGFVVPARPPRAPAPRAGIVVSAGGGRVGEPLLRAAVAGHLPGRRVRVIGGPFLDDDAWEGLRAAAAGRPGLELVRTVPDLETELEHAAASVSQCGYNTALEVVRAGVPALVVPFADPGEDEQLRRARRLERLGALRVLHPRDLTPAALADAIGALDAFTPAAHDLALDGAAVTADTLERRLHARAAAA